MNDDAAACRRTVGWMAVRGIIAGLWIACVLQAAPAIFPLKDIRAGQHGVGRTVFAGTRVEEFQVEILGVLDNLGPRQSIILARLSGGPLANTGVMQGMSGSPVYIDGRLAGAVALSFPLSKEAIAGIRPIEDMLRVEPNPSSDADRRLAANLPPRRDPVRDPVNVGPFFQRSEAGGNRNSHCIFRIHRSDAGPFRTATAHPGARSSPGRFWRRRAQRSFGRSEAKSSPVP